VGDGADRGMLGLVRLDDRAPGLGAPPRATDRLGEELVRALGCALVREVEGDVGRDDPDEGHRWDVQALGHEAGPDQHVEAVVAERVDDPLRGAPSLDDVTVEPAHAERWKPIANLALDALRAATEVADPGRPTVRTA